MKWVVDSTPEKQASYVCFLAKNLQMGFFAKDGFLVLPYAAPKVSKSVFFPNFGYSPAFWQHISQNTHLDLDQTYPPACLNELLSQIPLLKYPPVNIPDLNRFWSLCESHFGKKTLSKIKSIHIIPTPYGTIGSFVPRTSKLYLTWRTDMPQIHICRTLLLAIFTYITKLHAEIGEIPYYQRQASIDFLLRHPPFKQFFTDLKYSPVTQKQILDSQIYLQKLGFGNPKAIPEIPNLSAQEQAFWQALTQTKLLSFDAAATAVWGDNSYDKYSPYTLAKIVQSLRRKLAVVSPSSSIITLRKQGYLFLN